MNERRFSYGFGKAGYMKENQRHEPTEDYFHLEDLAMKTAAQYFTVKP